MKKILTTIASCLLINSALPAIASYATDVQGQATVNYYTIFPAYRTGSFCKGATDTACIAFENKCKQEHMDILGTSATINYTINAEILIHSAYYTYAGKTIKLSALGIDGRYSFVSKDLTPELEALGVKNVFFTVDKDFKKFTSNFIFNGNDEEKNYQCIVSNYTPDNIQ